MQEQLTSANSNIRAQKKHVVLFSVACVLFAISWILQLVGVIGLPLYFLDSLLKFDPSSGGGVLIQLLTIMSLPLVPVITMEVMSILWAIGLIPTGILKRRKSELPRRMKNAVEMMFDANMVMMAIGLGFFLITTVMALISNWEILV